MKKLLGETLKGRLLWYLAHRQRNCLRSSKSPRLQFLSSMIIIVLWLMLNEFRRNGAKCVFVVLLKLKHGLALIGLPGGVRMAFFKQNPIHPTYFCQQQQKLSTNFLENLNIHRMAQKVKYRTYFIKKACSRTMLFIQLLGKFSRSR
jgi:hypothetical protein